MKDTTVEAALQLIGHAIALKLHVQLDQPGDARHQLEHAFTTLGAAGRRPHPEATDSDRCRSPLEGETP